MSMYGTPTSGRPFARPTLDAVDLTQGRERLLAPGVVPLPGLSKQAAELEQVMGIIGGIGSVASGAASLIRTDTAQRRAAQAEADQVAAEEDRRAREYNIGLAEQDATNISTDVGAQIQTGKVTVDPANFGTFVDQIVATRGTLQNKDYQDALRRRVGTMVAREVQQARVVQEQRTQADIFDKLTSRAYTDPSSAPDVVRTLNESFSNLPEGVRFKPVFDAAKRLAEQGSDQYKTVADQLPESYAIDKGILENQYKVAQSRFTAQRAQNAENVIGQYRYGGNYQGALATLQGFVDTGVLDGEKANTIKKGIEEEQRAALNQSKASLVQAREEEIKNAFRAGVGSAIDAGVAWSVPNLKQEITLDDGTKRTVQMTRNEAIDEEMQKRLAPKGGVPPITTENITLATNSEYVVPQWKNLFETAASSLGQYSLNVSNGKVADQPTANVLTAFGAYKQMLAMGKADYATRLTDSATIEKFATAARMQQTTNGVGGGTPVSDVQALLGAIQSFNAPTKVDEKTLKNAIEDVGPNWLQRAFSNAKPVENTGELLTVLSPIVAMKSKTLAPDKAVEETMKEYAPRLVSVNGFYHLAQADFPGGMKANMDKIFDQIAGEYVAKYGKSKGVTTENLTLRPDPNANIWQLVVKGQPGVAFTDSINDVTFSYEDLGSAYTRWETEQRDFLIRQSKKPSPMELLGRGFTP